VASKEAVNFIEFEKDNDKKFHIDFISACANLRARNYHIPEAPRHEVKIIAGKIIPAIATTTAMVVGIVAFEIFKYVGFCNKFINQDSLDVYKCTNCNLAIPSWNFNFVSPAQEFQDVDKGEDEIFISGAKALRIEDPVTGEPRNITVWDQIIFQAPATIRDIVAHFEEKYQLKVYKLIYKDKTLYNDPTRSSEQARQLAAERLNMTIEEVYKQIFQVALDPKIKFMKISVMAKELDGKKMEVRVPDLKYLRN